MDNVGGPHSLGGGCDVLPLCLLVGCPISLLAVVGRSSA